MRRHLPETLRASYDIHGVTCGVEVAGAVGEAALDAIDRRLRPFRCETPETPEPPENPAAPADAVLGGPEVRILVGTEALTPPAGPSRPVYDSVAGPVRYHDSEATLYAEHRGGAQLRCQAAAGVAELSCHGALPDSIWLATHPLLTLALIELLKHRHRYSLHAACLAAGDRGILVTGPSGAGKTTLAVALVRRGLQFVADDMVFLAAAPAGIEVLGFADEVDVTDNTLSMFAELRPAARRQLAGGGKWSLRLEDAFATPYRRRCRPSLLVLARVADRDRSAITRLPAAKALVDLTPNVLLTEAGSAQAHLAMLAQLVQATPCVRLDTGRDFDRLPAMLAEASELAIP